MKFLKYYILYCVLYTTSKFKLNLFHFIYAQMGLITPEAFKKAIKSKLFAALSSSITCVKQYTMYPQN